jgi:hypothetical protein
MLNETKKFSRFRIFSLDAKKKIIQRDYEKASFSDSIVCKAIISCCTQSKPDERKMKKKSIKYHLSSGERM